MSDGVRDLLLAALGGAGIALLYLAALRASVRRATRREPAGIALAGGAVLRIALVCAGLWAVAGGEALRVLAALVGFVGVRSLALAIVGRPGRETPPEGRSITEPRS